MPDEAVATFDLATTLRFSEVALDALGAAREEIDALNVYPVPDGDTGTNLFLTFESARNAMLEKVEGSTDGDLRGPLSAFARGALLGARGNSGVILSQLIGALAKRINEAGPGDRSATVLAEGMARATEASYAAVGDPVEGTILSVAKAASEAAGEAAETASNRLGQVIRAAATAARGALARTPEQLQILKDAGVVDAGGRGLCVILDAAETAVTGKRPVGSQLPLGTRSIPVPLPSGDLTADGPAYEVMYLLDAAEPAIAALRRDLTPLGDSLVVVGGDGLWNVHVHVDDVGAAVEAGIEAGRPFRIRVTHFAEQADRGAATAASERRGRQVVVVAAGEGLMELFAQAGATVVAAGPGRRPATSEILAAVAQTTAAEVIILPNDRDSIAVAETAARIAREDEHLRVAVIPTSAQVHGLAALAVHEPGRHFEQDVLEMTSAARHARSGAVTVAARRAMTSAGPCEPGEVLGAIEGDFVLVGDDLLTVAVDVLDRLLGGGGELVTIVSGAGSGNLAERCASHVADQHPTVDVVVYDGGQERYPLLLGVE
ncbi:MAG: DAK2 domain-containing protein [Actinomycetota bacterium]|nr:DAK2 domain-containing protein [Actinomycetota bacterium]